MRNFFFLLAIVGCLPLTSGSLHAGSPTATGAKEIAQLITQLGSASFKEREAANHALEAIGGPALGALQQAALSSDPEVGRRAQCLARMIRRRIDTAQILAPLPVHLVYRDTPLLQAVEDLARRTGFPIEIAGGKERLANRRITLDTGEATFWEAFDRFCHTAGLVEKPAAPGTELDANNRLLSDAAQRQRALVQMMETPTPNLGFGRVWDGRLNLVDGQQSLLPTDHIGAVRIRALPVSGSSAKRSSDPFLFTLEITPQPKLPWQNIVDLRIDKALDEDGRDWAPALETRNESGTTTTVATGVMLWDAQTGQPFTPPRDFPVRLKSGEKPLGRLKEIKGILAAQVQTPPQPIVTIDHIGKAIGRTGTGDEGESLKLTALERQPNGNVHIQVELTDASSANVVWGVRRGVLRPNAIRVVNGVVRRGGMAIEASSPATFVLQDAEGHSFPLSGQSEEPVINGNVVARQISCTYHSRAGLREPTKLIYSARRMIIIEVPFTLRDVPLP
ncbi:MAG TPA: hypothetical protein VKU02_17575 [Gemmataceae bacterium]|nr:hypothetical protein [Gemmataceae bacterium]